MIIDSHFHFDTHLLPEEKLIEKMNNSGVDKIALIAVMNGDIPHTNAILMKLYRFLITHGWSRGLAKKLGNNFTKDGNIALPDGQIEIFPDPDNAPVFKATDAHPERFLGWVFVNPRGQNDMVEEFEKWRDKPGFIGVKAHPFWHQFQPTELLPVARLLVKTGKPLLVHLGFDQTDDFLRLINQVPDLKVVAAHTGFPDYSDFWKIIRDRRNIVVDLSASGYVNAKTTRDAVAYLGADRCLFGTDGPYAHNGEDGLFNYGFIKNRIETIFPDESTRKKILGENFAALIGDIAS